MVSDLLALRAWRELYSNEPQHELRIRYSGHFKGYNASVLRNSRAITFSLAKNFEETSEEVKLGVMQHLLNRLFKTKHDTMEIQLYNSFLKKLTDYSETTRVDPELKARFDVVNQEYFDGFMMTPNLVWGQYSLTKLGHYEFATDTIVLSTALREDEMLLDYVLYHEMLHKKHKFSERAGGFTRAHTTAFRTEEKEFKVKDAEKRLAVFLRQKRRERRWKGDDASRSGDGRSVRPPRRRRGFFRSLFDYF
jgi:hypothetical protein